MAQKFTVKPSATVQTDDIQADAMDIGPDGILRFYADVPGDTTRALVASYAAGTWTHVKRQGT